MRINTILLFLCIACSFNALAQSHANEFGFQSDNDSFLGGGSDRYYTNGIFLHYRRALNVSDANSAHLKNKILGFEAGHKIFNSYTGRLIEKDLIDRPIAAYLYIGSNLNLLYANESNLKMGAQVGIIGPGALGEDIQKFIHNTFGFYEISGWQYQVKNSFQLNFNAEYNRLLARSSNADFLLNTYANAGTGFTGAGLGATMRLGSFNQLFNSVSTQSTATKKQSFTPLHKNEIFFYYKPMLNFVAYDATIQGGIFEKHDNSGDEVTLSKNPFIVINQLGVAHSSKRWVFDASVIFHTREVKKMIRPHKWGAVTILYRFN
ncbi:MAG: lipid A deacylase LpxR family protein [Sphingobacteriaceae bacterium]|nr:MAG: lipid A deacylase LpxR family protein [Sphingobacteriaceae bacterium]